MNNTKRKKLMAMAMNAPPQQEAVVVVEPQVEVKVPEVEVKVENKIEEALLEDNKFNKNKKVKKSLDSEEV